MQGLVARHPRSGELAEWIVALRPLALRLTGGDEADASDLLQDAAERALRRLERGEAVENLRGWLVAIVHNLFIDRCRRVSRAPRHEPIDPRDETLHADPPCADPAWAALDPTHVEDALGRLDPDFRRTYELATMDRLPYVEIGRRLGIPKNTVGTRVLRARRKLRAMLAPLIGIDTEEAGDA